MLRSGSRPLSRLAAVFMDTRCTPTAAWLGVDWTGSQRGHVLADPAEALDRPDPVGPLPGITHQRPVADLVGGEPAATVHDLVAGHHLDGDRPCAGPSR
jgi:hypothetical protein